MAGRDNVRLYIGNLASLVDEKTLRSKFEDSQVSILKLEFTCNGYAFIEVSSEDAATCLNTLNGMEIAGNSIRVELSTSRPEKRRVRNNKVLVHNFNEKQTVDEIRAFLSQHAPVKNLVRANNRFPNKASYIVTFETIDEAERVFEEVNGKSFNESVLKVIPFSDNHFKKTRAPSSFPNLPNPVYPFRFLIPTALIGALIGVNGATVRRFQVDCGARYIIVDVHQKDERFPHEKPVTVLGSAESQITALRNILKFLDNLVVERQGEDSSKPVEKVSSKEDTASEVPEREIQPEENSEQDDLCKKLENGHSEHLTNGHAVSSDEAATESSQNENHHDSNETSSTEHKSATPRSTSPNSQDTSLMNFVVPLPIKILTHDHLIGRLIGKGGAHLAGIKQDTETNITIPALNEQSENGTETKEQTYIERIITIEGERTKTVQAAEAMLYKLRNAYDKDMDYIMREHENMQSLYNPHVTPGLSFLPSPALTPVPMDMYAPRMTPAMLPLGMGLPPAPMYETGDPSEITYLYIHHGAVGAIIGNRGTNIHMVKQLSGAQVTVDTQNDHCDQRKITLVGTPDAQSKAQWLIFEKLRSEGYTNGEWPILTSEMPIPANMVGRIIGKQGKKVLELQRESHAVIEVPMSNGAHGHKSSASGSGGGPDAPAGTQGSPSAREGGNNSSKDHGIIMVKVLGHYWALQSAQRRIRAIINRQKLPLAPAMSSNHIAHQNHSLHAGHHPPHPQDLPNLSHTQTNHTAKMLTGSPVTTPGSMYYPGNLLPAGLLSPVPGIGPGAMGPPFAFPTVGSQCIFSGFDTDIPLIGPNGDQSGSFSPPPPLPKF